MLTNQLFCYWLQGYFELSRNPELNECNIQLIKSNLAKIGEPLGPYTQWLSDTLRFLTDHMEVGNPMLPLIQQQIIKELNFVFYHDIDNSYDTDCSSELLLKIHNGETVMHSHGDGI